MRGLRSYDGLDPKGYRVGYLALIDLFAAYVRPSQYQTVVGGILPVNQPSSYLAYGDAFSTALSAGTEFSPAYLDFVGQGVSAVRRLELALFLHGRHLQSQAASSRREKLRKQQVEGLGGEAE